MSETDFAESAMAAARLAGTVLEEWAEKFTASEKSPANLVTEADLESQKAIHGYLSEHFPEHQFLGEEELLEAKSASPYRWLIDPLDGTSNYVHHFPYYAVSIGLEYRGDLIVGVVFDPTRDEMFCAIQGQGAWLNGRPIRPTTASDLDQALVVASFPVNTSGDDPAVAAFLRVLPRAQHLQRTGSAALNLAYVAAGRMEAYWSQSLKPWDMAAGVVLVAEVGGRVTRVDGSPIDLSVPDLVASNGTAIHEQLRELLVGRHLSENPGLASSSQRDSGV